MAGHPVLEANRRPYPAASLEISAKHHAGVKLEVVPVSALTDDGNFQPPSRCFLGLCVLVLGVLPVFSAHKKHGKR